MVNDWIATNILPHDLSQGTINNNLIENFTTTVDADDNIIEYTFQLHPNILNTL